MRSTLTLVAAHGHGPTQGSSVGPDVTGGAQKAGRLVNQTATKPHSNQPRSNMSSWTPRCGRRQRALCGRARSGPGPSSARWAGLGGVASVGASCLDLAACDAGLAPALALQQLLPPGHLRSPPPELRRGAGGIEGQPRLGGVCNAPFVNRDPMRPT